MSSILLRNISLEGCLSDIYIEDGLISRISAAGGAQKAPAGPQAAGNGAATATTIAPDTEIVDCTGHAALPAFVNMHTHSAMSMLKGVGEDMELADWLDKIWQIEANIDAEFIYWGTKVACLEMIRTGTVTFNDHYWFSTTGHRAAIEMGLRPVVSYVVIDKDDPNEAEREKEQIIRMYEESLKWPDPHSFAAAFHAVYSVSDNMIAWIAEFAKKHGLRLHFHLSETENEIKNCIAKTGLSPVQYVDRLGALDENAIAAHTLWLDDKDIETLGKRRVNCVHNINSNLKLASGYKFKYTELRDAGANICLGTDGCASSNNLDMLEAIKTSAIVQKAWRGDPLAMPLDELFDTATINGARALGLNTGAIREGMAADILIVDTDNPFFITPAPILANFIYSAHSDCITSVISKGKFVMRDRKIEGEQEILEETRKVLKKYIDKNNLNYGS